MPRISTGTSSHHLVTSSGLYVPFSGRPWPDNLPASAGPSPPHAQFPFSAFLWWQQMSLSIRTHLYLIELTFQSPPLEHEPHVSRDLCLFHVCICSMRKSSWPIVGAQQMMKVTFGHQPLKFMAFSELILLNVQYVSSRTSSPYLHSHTGIIRNRYPIL